ncbi:DUF4238 domain-containing protein [Mesorhizobium sp. M0898]|uniref:DUF4238 domain-containing protein n=1 Tax=Mesorhizobium sp. M0898 TaxID=2957020 RepID=UPI00333BC2A2
MASRKQKLPTDHHFVPQFILRNFMDGNGELHAYDRRSPPRGVFSTPPAKVFFEKNLYTAIKEDGTRNVDLETGFRPLEHAASILIRTIIDAARQGVVHRLSLDDRNLLDAFLYFQWKRVPDSINRVVSRSDLKAFGIARLKEFEETTRPLTEDEKEKFEDPATWERIMKNARRDTIARGSTAIMQVLSGLVFNVVHIRNPKKAFIVGSHPVSKLHPAGEAQLNGARTELWLPVASDVAIAFTGSGKSQHVALWDGDQIRKVNQATAWGSSLIASRSPLLTRSLITHVGSRMHLVGLQSSGRGSIPSEFG